MVTVPRSLGDQLTDMALSFSFTTFSFLLLCGYTYKWAIFNKEIREKGIIAHLLMCNTQSVK
jgi:hypothetical protein